MGIFVGDIRWSVPEGRVAVYVGRPWKNIQGSVLGNPFHVEKGGKAGDASATFRHWLWDDGRYKVRGGRTIRGANIRTRRGLQYEELVRIYRLSQQGDVVLQCHCNGRSTCHAHVIKRAVENFVSKDELLGGAAK